MIKAGDLVHLWTHLNLVGPPDSEYSESEYHRIQEIKTLPSGVLGYKINDDWQFEDQIELITLDYLNHQRAQALLVLDEEAQLINARYEKIKKELSDD